MLQRDALQPQSEPSRKAASRAALGKRDAGETVIDS